MDELYVVDMELYGETLQDYLRASTHRRIPLSEVWNIMLQLASGLAFLHKFKLVHRDIKPSNGAVLH